MKTLSIDIETYSDLDLAKCGVYKYAQSPKFEIMLFAYSVDGAPVKVVDLVSDKEINKAKLKPDKKSQGSINTKTSKITNVIPPEIIAALNDKSVIKWAFNAAFERVCLSAYLGYTLQPQAWRCSMVLSAMLGLPMSLADVGELLSLEKPKMKEGKALVKYFCKPCPASKVNGGRRRNLPEHAPEKWELFKQYNKRDVETEMQIRSKLEQFSILESEWKNYEIDQAINDRGIKVNAELAANAIELSKIFTGKTLQRAKELTGLENPNSPQQLKEYLFNMDYKVFSLNKDFIQQEIEDINIAQTNRKQDIQDAEEELAKAETRWRSKAEIQRDIKQDREYIKKLETVRQVLTMRKELSKTSVKKYESIVRCMCSDERLHGLLQFYGASRTGRWAGRLVQIQNLPQNHIQNLDRARSLLLNKQFRQIEEEYNSTAEVLSQLIRTAFVPKKNHKFIVADFSAIEARVIAWLAGEKWRMDVFAGHGKIYEASAAEMFGVPIESIKKGDELRQKGKIAELACGYGGGVGALKTMGAVKMGLDERELKVLIQKWRASNPNIVNLWHEMDKASKMAVKQGIWNECYGIKFALNQNHMHITIPSGRKLCFANASAEKNKFGWETISYWGTGQGYKWTKMWTYGAKLTENIVQAIARDILALAIQRIEENGYKIVMTVHDEVVIEAEKDASINEVCAIMCQNPPWTNGLILKADAYECDYYKKGE